MDRHTRWPEPLVMVLKNSGTTPLTAIQFPIILFISICEDGQGNIWMGTNKPLKHWYCLGA